MNPVPTSSVSALIFRFRSRLTLKAEILALRHQLNFLNRFADAGRHLRTSDRVLGLAIAALAHLAFTSLDHQAGDGHSDSGCLGMGAIAVDHLSPHEPYDVADS